MDRTLKRHISIGVFVVYIDTVSSMPISPSKSRDLADENNKILTEWKWFETTVFHSWRGILDATLCKKVCQWLAADWWLKWVKQHNLYPVYFPSSKPCRYSFKMLYKYAVEEYMYMYDVLVDFLQVFLFFILFSYI